MKNLLASEGTPSAMSSFSIDKLAMGAISLFGISGVLYGAGFLVLRSHYTFLGIWGSLTWSSTEITEEGGKFFFHLIVLPVSKLASLNLRLLVLLVIVGLLSDLIYQFHEWFAKFFRWLQPSWLEKTQRQWPALIIGVLVITRCQHW